MTVKKVLYFVTEDWYFVSHRLPLAKAAQQAGYEVAVTTRVQKHHTQIENEGITVFPIHMERRSVNPLSAFKTFFELRKIIKDYQPDLIHLVALKPILLGNLAALTEKTKVINAFTGMGYLYSSEKFHHKVIRNLFLLLYRLMFWINKAHVIVQNKDDYALFADKKVLSLSSLHLIKGSGVDIHKFSPKKTPSHTLPRALLVARALKDKGLREYIEAAKILKKRKIPLTCQFAGMPDPENPTSLTETELLEAHDAGFITWLGYRSDIAELWQDADIAVLPSYREGLPKTLLEAAAAGKPLIATDVPGCREICIDGVNGLLIPPREIEVLSIALEKLTSNPTLREEMGIKSRQIVEEELSLKEVNKSTINIYKETIK